LDTSGLKPIRAIIIAISMGRGKEIEKIYKRKGKITAKTTIR
jgi:hypothetical protein